MRALADKTKLPVSRDALVQSIDNGLAVTSVERTPLRYSRGVTLMAAEGGADSVYVNKYKDGFNPMYLL